MTTIGLRGVRGAITVDTNSKEAIVSATQELIEHMISENKIKTEDIASVFFTTTTDLNADFPAQAARKLGMNLVPLLCASEIAVPGALAKCIRILIHWNTNQSQAEIKHAYLGGAKVLREDLK
jgi:chorismate mutase